MVLTDPVAPGSDTVQFVYELDAGSQQPGPRKQLAQVGFALADPFRKDFRTTDQFKVSVAFRGDRLGQERLAVARRTIQENAALRLDPQRLKVRSVRERQLDNILELLQGRVLAGDVGITDAGHIASRLGGLGLTVQGKYPILFLRSHLELDAQRLLGVERRGLDLEETVLAQCDELGKVVDVGTNMLPAEGRAELAAIGAGLLLQGLANGRFVDPENILLSG